MYDVCIIGGGQSGLVTCKTFIEQNKNVIILEKCNNCIGMFSTIKEKELFKWSSSRYVSGFSDFPIPKSVPVWFTIKDYIEYLTSYMHHFGLDKYIQYNSNVTKCYQNKQEEWVVEYNNARLICKKLIICAGLNQTPKFPEIINDFTGEVIHTEYVYRNMYENDWKRKFSGKRILLLGGAESAYDIGHVIVQYSDQVYYSTKNYTEWFPPGNEPPEIIKRIKKIDNKCFNGSLFLNKTPTDTQLNYIEHSLPEPMSHVWHEYGRPAIIAMFSIPFYLKYGNVKCPKCTHNHNKLCEINETPNSLFKKYVVKRTDFLLDMFENKVNILYYPDKIQGRTAYTKEQIIDDIDIIICATGFKKQIPFLENDVWSGILIKKMIPKKYSNIAFIGYARPTMGSIAAVAEIQSWWVHKYFYDKSFTYNVRTPLFREIDQLNIPNEHINTIVNGCFYIKDLAKDLHIEPNMIYLFFTDLKLFFKIFTGTCHPMMYRIHGYKSYDNARDTFLETYIEENKKGLNQYLYLLFFIALHILFITFLIIIAFALSHVVYISKQFKKYAKYKNDIFVYMSLTLIFIFYKYF
jgi:hypothetical protein